MPVGKLTDDGEIVPGSRHGAHKGGLGQVTAWNCPACGVKNEGRRPEQGCIHCGAGDPLKSTAGAPVQEAPRKEPVAARPRPAVSPARSGSPLTPPAPSVAQARVIYRLIEYVITQPAGGQETLRRSLVGTLQFPWGQLTGAIVDSVDSRQEDLLRMARMQPGVWIGNSEAMGVRPGWTVTPLDREIPPVTRGTVDRPPDINAPDIARAVEEFTRLRERSAMDLPDTGPAFSQEEADFAEELRATAGRALGSVTALPFIHTLALALSNVAMELEGNMEPLKFLDSGQCSRLANALMSLIPSDWDPQPPQGEEATGG